MKKFGVFLTDYGPVKRSRIYTAYILFEYDEIKIITKFNKRFGNYNLYAYINARPIASRSLHKMIMSGDNTFHFEGFSNKRTMKGIIDPESVYRENLKMFDSCDEETARLIFEVSDNFSPDILPDFRSLYKLKLR